MSQQSSLQSGRNIEAIRRDVDAIDRQIIALFKKRLALSDEAILFKTSVEDITNPDHTASLLKRVDRCATELEVPAELVRRVYDGVIAFVLPRHLAGFAELQRNGPPSKDQS
jgi:chorismate mutase